MSILESAARPFVKFDPTDKKHRRWFSEFVRTRSWASCPIRFTIDEESGNLFEVMHEQLVAFYISREFFDNKYSKSEEIIS